MFGSGLSLTSSILSVDSVNDKYLGTFSMVSGRMIIDGKRIFVTNELNPTKIQWGNNGDDVVGFDDVVGEATGKFLDEAGAPKHFVGGGKKVIMSVPPKDNTPMFVMGVNRKEYTKDLRIVTNASCTTNCLAPLAKVINDNFGIKEGIMSTTVHEAIHSQPAIDDPFLKDRNGGCRGNPFHRGTRCDQTKNAFKIDLCDHLAYACVILCLLHTHFCQETQ